MHIVHISTSKVSNNGLFFLFSAHSFWLLWGSYGSLCKFPWHFSEVQVILLHFLLKWKCSCVFSHPENSGTDLTRLCKEPSLLAPRLGFCGDGCKQKSASAVLQPFMFSLWHFLLFSLDFKLHLCMCVCVCGGMCTCMPASVEAKGMESPWSWGYRQL